MMKFIDVYALAALLQLLVLSNAAPPSTISITKPASLNVFSQDRNITAPFDNSLSNMSSFPDPYDFVVGNNQLTIEFYGYQDNVKPTYMDSCVSDANGQIIQKIMADQKNTQMGTDPYSWSCGNVSLYLVPEEQLTWGRWSLVPVAIANFVTENALKGTQFILLWHGLGPIGYGQLVASSEAPSLMTDVGVNNFPDPYDKIIESIGLTIEFYGYQGSISPIAMRDCISAASNDVVQHIHEGKGTVKMEAPSYSYSAGEVNLFLIPTEDLTWNMWAFVPVWILEFVTENNFRGAQFILLWEGFGPVGSGQLINTSTDTVSAPRLGVF